ncbi:branched-chain amino acid ABC transporter permease [Aerobium aerolatum]|uniref:Branched-chain amino acid transport system permease protein n=1 Tax=Aquamicrobium aerolatum DSM 21857 TaxID=1121003 RepID=A0A1I3IG40_9HYPH|nr:branched-chain amino acid ABC transporter permease [Aquamicrobium aerolatum]SFI47005.1 branched-chain amino acid transport system permease protein [Aquamicrobium aerolatum DSM 21857]
MLVDSFAKNRPAIIAIAIVLLVFGIVPMFGSNYQISIATEILIFALLAMSIDVLAGFAGRTSLGHGAIFGASTYVVVYWTSVVGGSPIVAVALGILAATLVAAVFGMLASRVSGVYFLLLTLALGMIVWGVALRWTSVSGGENGLRGVGRPEWLNDPTVFFYICLGIVLTLSAVIWRLVQSPFGLTLRGIRDSESRMSSLGYGCATHMFIAFTTTGFFAGVAGALYALFNNFVSPSTVQLSQSVEGLLMAILGGIGTLFGAFIGAAAIILLENFVSQYTARWPMVLGFMFIATMIFAPEGVLGAIRRIFRVGKKS